MDLSSVLGFVLGVVAILAFAGAVALGVRYAGRRRQERRLSRAGELRSQAQEREATIAARETEAEDAARSADEARREAAMLEAGAEQLYADAASLRQQQLDELAEADQLAPEGEDEQRSS